MLLALGQTAFRTMLIDYCRKIPPQLYGFLEAEAFGRYLRELRLELPHLSKVLEFEPGDSQAGLANVESDAMSVAFPFH